MGNKHRKEHIKDILIQEDKQQYAIEYDSGSDLDSDQKILCRVIICKGLKFKDEMAVKTMTNTLKKYEEEFKELGYSDIRVKPMTVFHPFFMDLENFGSIALTFTGNREETDMELINRKIKQLEEKKKRLQENIEINNIIING